MKFLIVVAALVVSCIAVPNLPDNTATTARPGAINPSVSVSESKPIKTKEVSHHITKRDHKPGHDSHPVDKPKVPEPLKKSTPPQPPKRSDLKAQASSATKSTVPKRNRRNAPTTQQKEEVAAITLQKPQTLPAVIGKDEPKRQQTAERPKPLVTHHENPVPVIAVQKPQTLPAIIHKDEPKDLQTAQQPKPLVTHHGSNVPAIALQKPQTLPAIVQVDEPKNLQNPTATPSQKHKRDIPVPLVAKHKHPEASPKVSSSQEVSKENKSGEKKDKTEEHKQLVTPLNDKVQVEDLSEPKPLTSKPASSSLKHPHEFHPQRDHIENKHATSKEHNPVILGDVQQKPNINKGPAESVSTNDHPLIRSKPVPVAELFSRHHDN